MGTRMRMHQQAAGLAAGLLVALLAAVPARGENLRARSFSLQIDSGAAFIHEPGFGHGLRFGAGVFFKTAKRAGFEVLIERFEVPIDEGAGGLSAGRMDVTTLVLNQQVYFFTRGRFLPYAALGVGFAFIGYSPDDSAVLPEKDIVDRMALQVGGGLDFRLSAHTAVGGRVRYNMIKTWVEELPRTSPIRDTDPLAQDMLHLYGLELSLGLKVSF